MKKRVLSLLMAFALCLGLSAVAGAEETAQGEDGGHTHTVNENGECTECGAAFKASVTTEDGTLRGYYATLKEAFAAAGSYGTITLLSDVTLTETLAVSMGTNYENFFTLDLNGKKISCEIADEPALLVSATFTICDNSSEKTGAVTNNGDSGKAINSIQGGMLKITGGTFGTVNIYRSAEISGGRFSKIWSFDAYSGPPSLASVLAKGYAFQDNSGIINGHEKNSAENVTVVPCPHKSDYVNAETGECACGVQMTLKTTDASGNVTYGTDLAKVLSTAPNGATVTLLEDINSDSIAELNIYANITINLNGHKLTYSKESIYAYSKVNIVGKGDVECSIFVCSNSTLDLSGWSGNIDTVNVQEASSGLISGQGTIKNLYLYRSSSEFKNINLSSGTYNKISTTTSAKATLKELLANGFVFQALEDGLYYLSADEFKTLENVTVVQCPHSVINLVKDEQTEKYSASCRFCGLSDIVATVGDKVYTTTDTIEKAVTEWLASGGTLTLYTNYYNTGFTSFANAAGPWFAIDLNGFRFNNGVKMNLGGAYLSVLDSREGYDGAFGPIIADNGMLILNSGYLKGLTVNEESEATIALHGGHVEGLVFPYPIYKLLESGYALLNGNLTVDPTMKPQSTANYTVKNCQNTVTSHGMSGTVAYGEKNILLSLSLTTADSEIGLMQFEWYLVETDGTTALLASSADIAPNADGVYIFDAKNVTINADSWTGLDASTTPYDVICVVNGKASDGAYRWQTPIRGYKLTVEPFDLNKFKDSLEFRYMSGANVGNRFVVAPFGGHSDSLQELTYEFEVYLNGQKYIDLHTDYEIVNDSNKASTAGTHIVTIRGKGNYTGELSKQWKIEPYTLSSDSAELERPNISKTYDGTNSLTPPENFSIAINEDMSNIGTKNPGLSSNGIGVVIKLRKDIDYTVGDITFDSANAGDRTATFTITLKQGGNFIFDDGGRTLTVTAKSIPSGTYVKIDKATAPTNVSNGALTVYNQSKRTYEVDLLGLLPKLDSPKSYGAVTGGTVAEVALSDGYYKPTEATETAAANQAEIKDGKLLLPIESVSSTKTEQIGTVKLTVNTTNYQPITLTIDVSAANQPASGGGGGGSTTTNTETTTNPDGSVTKTETKSDGTVIETTTKPDGSVSKTESKTTTKSDGSTVETVTETNTGADGSKSTSKTETTTNKDGSKTETKSETKTEADGTKSETKSETKTDANGVTSGKETTKTTAPNGSTGTTTTTTENGNSKTEAEAKVSEKAVEDAKKSGEAVKVPTEVKAGEDSNSAPTVKVELPKNAGETKIEIPVSDVNSSTVAVIVRPDGTEEIVKDSKPTEDGLQLTVDGSATVKIIDNSKTFDDTRDHWSRDEVNFVASREIFNGVGGNRFGVDQPMTRGMVNTVLARLAGVDTTPSAGQKWYEVGTAWAKQNGITDGTNPEASVTREQLATLLYRFCGTPEVKGDLLFNDAHEVSDYAQSALLWATQNGILNGVGNERIAPGADAQRAQVAAMMARYLKNVG